jgi:hypothetical protein
LRGRRGPVRVGVAALRLRSRVRSVTCAVETAGLADREQYPEAPQCLTRSPASQLGRLSRTAHCRLREIPAASGQTTRGFRPWRRDRLPPETNLTPSILRRLSEPQCPSTHCRATCRNVGHVPAVDNGCCELAQLGDVARSSGARASSPAKPVKAQCATTIKSVSSLVSLLMP